MESADQQPMIAGQIRDTIESVADQLHRSASVDSVFGEPIERGEKTVVPVARIGYGIGGGYGTDEDEEGGSGSGIGGGVSARPVGVVEISGTETRFVRMGSRRRLSLALAAGIILGYVLGRRR